MSLNKKRELRHIAKIRCRELRKNSTNAEMIFWNKVRNRKFIGKKFYRQYPVFYDINGKESFYIADFYCHESRLIVELDGSIHDFRKTEDEIRSEVINNLGIRVIRFSNNEIELNINNVLNKLSELL